MTGFAVTFQGRLVKAKSHRSSSEKITPPVGRRGSINGFSDRSRKRMIELVSTLSIPESSYFVTLTFPDDAAPYSGTDAKNSLRALFERLRRALPESSAIWRMEIKRRKSGRFKGREVPHFHLLAFNMENLYVPIPYAQTFENWLHLNWASVLQVDYARVEAQALKSANGAMYYCSKYVAKKEEPCDPLVSLPYLHAQGRHWGVFNRFHLPQFEPIKIQVHNKVKAFQDFKRAFKKHYPNHRVAHEWQGFTLFTDNAFRWLDYLELLIDQTDDF